MTKSGDVLDGAHRIAKAYLQREWIISAIVNNDYPPPVGVAEVSQSQCGRPIVRDEIGTISTDWPRSSGF
jgi:hypothetical protein